MAELTPILMSPQDKRDRIRTKVLEGLQESFPIKSRNKTLELADLHYEQRDFSPSEQKEAILKGDTLSEVVKGTVVLKDAEGKVIDKAKNFTLARIPWFTPRHTLIVGGNEYSVSNMVRPKPGVYARKRSNGILEAQFNIVGGSNFNVSMDPEKGIPHLEYGATKIPVYPILRKAGVSHEQISEAWGKKMADYNHTETFKKADQTVEKLYGKMVPEYARKSGATTDDMMQEIVRRYGIVKMDPEVNSRTLGKPYDTVTPHSILDASGKILRIFRQADEVDDRDNLDFKSFHSIENFFKERIKLDAREVARKAAIKAESTPEIRRIIPAGPFSRGLVQFINTSQLVAVPTQTNPLELIDSAMRVTSLGEGGISTERAIPMEARQTHVTQIGALDPIRTPESFRAGIDIRAAMRAMTDERGNLHVPIYDVKANKHRYIRAGELQSSVVAFPHQEIKGKVDALVNGVVREVPASQVQYQIPHPSVLYSPTTNLLPFLESSQGNRAIMGAKHQTQALSLIEREEPYVQVRSQTGKSFENLMGGVINPVAPVAGTVAKIDKNYIYIRPAKTKLGAAGDAGLVKVPYETNFPLAAKTFLHHDLNVKEGDEVKAGQHLGESNFTRNGTLALGKNLRVAYMPYHGYNSNDAVVISEGAAKKLTSERMYKIVIPRDPDLTFNKDKHQVYYGNSYLRDHYKNVDAEGVIKAGTQIHPGEPVVFSLRKSQLTSDDLMLGRLHKSLARPFRDSTNTWEHDHPGEVIDVVKTPKRITVTVRTKEPMTVGDKLSGRFGNKGVVSLILPDDQMVKDEGGKPIDVIMTSAGVVSRINPSQIIESAVGKVVEKTGKPIFVDNFTGKNNVQWAKNLLKENGVKDKETVLDPVTGKKIPGVFVGRQYVFKLFKSTDTNYSARGVDTYDVNQQPTKGGAQSAKAIGKMEFDALIGHNARNVLQESATIKSQRNDEFWRSLQLGYPTPPPKAAFASDKFLNMLVGAGVRVHREGSRMSLAPLTDGDVLKMSAGEIKEPTLVRAKDLKPETGGLFDPVTTGGLTGQKWAHVTLAEPIVHPVFRDPVRRLLGMNGPQLDKAIVEKGGKWIQGELKKIDLDAKEKELLASMKGKRAGQLDNQLKQVKYIRALKAQNLTPDKAYIVSHVPVVPPVYRPVLPGRGGSELMYADVNPLYRDLIYVNNQFKEIKEAGVVPDEEKNLRPVLHAAVGAVFGTGDPITTKSQARGHKGFLTYIAGVSSPKYGYFQSKLMKRTQDVAGRGTIVPDLTLGMDEVGIPDDMLWTMWEKFIIKRLVGQGYSAIQAQQMVKDRHPVAKEALMRETRERPVMVNRAPTLHRFNIIASYPRPVPGKTIRINPFMEKAMNADYDGDTMQVHSPVSIKAVEEAKGMTLSNMLFHDKAKKDLLVFPQHEAIMGVDHASTVDEGNKPVRFKTEAEAMKAYHEGKIRLGTRVQIGD
jgi:DNA-directed RNA polymerase beta subunit